MPNVTIEDLLKARVHVGHLASRWNPKMQPFIFEEKKGIHIIDLNKTLRQLELACRIVRAFAERGQKILFVGTKKQAAPIVKEAAQRVEMPYVVERWLGGMLTNFVTVKKSIHKLQQIERMFQDETVRNITKKERNRLLRQKEKMNKVLEGVRQMQRLPQAIFVVDIVKEHIAVAEARRLNIPIIAMVDTNADPTLVNYPIPANDDSAAAIELIVNYLADCIAEGKQRREAEKAAKSEEGPSAAPPPVATPPGAPSTLENDAEGEAK